MNCKGILHSVRNTVKSLPAIRQYTGTVLLFACNLSYPLTPLTIALLIDRSGPSSPDAVQASSSSSGLRGCPLPTDPTPHAPCTGHTHCPFTQDDPCLLPHLGTPAHNSGHSLIHQIDIHPRGSQHRALSHSHLHSLSLTPL